MLLYDLCGLPFFTAEIAEELRRVSQIEFVITFLNFDFTTTLGTTSPYQVDPDSSKKFTSLRFLNLINAGNLRRRKY